MRTAIYIRVSTEEQNEEHQLRAIKERFDVGENSKVYRDKQTAFKDHHSQRPAFSEIYKKVKKGAIQKLYVFDLDRIYRNRVRTVAFLRLCTTKGVKIFSHNQNFLSDVANAPPPWNEIMYDLMAQIFGYIAEEESKTKSERVKSAYQNHDGNWGRPKADVQTEEVLRLRSEGKSYREIGDILDISRTTVGRIISNQ